MKYFLFPTMQVDDKKQKVRAAQAIVDKWGDGCEMCSATVISVMRTPPKLEIGTLRRLMDDCLPDQIENEQDMQKLINKLWPALCCEFEQCRLPEKGV